MVRRPPSSRRSLALAPSLFGALLVALVSLPFTAPPAAASGWRDYIANCDVNVRTSASTSATSLKVIPTDSVVTTSNELAGGSWSANCGRSLAGSRWFAIVKINGTSVLSLFGVSPVYAAKGLFRAANVLEGIDVSQWNGTIDYTAVKASGRSFVVAKATEGIGFTDPTWARNRSAASAAGLAVTGYHFARPDLNPGNPVGEADWFASQLGLTPGMLVPALDLEVSGGLSTTALINWVQGFLDEVYRKTGARPMIYVSPGFWSGHMGDTRKFADEGYTVLWVAHWYVNTPTVPAQNWGGHGWTFWQYTDCGIVPGVPSKCVDLDRFNGTDMSSVTYAAGFTVDATPDQQSVEQGASASLTVSLVRSNFTLPIDLSIAGLPAGASANIVSSPTSGTSASIGVTTTAGSTGTTPAGTYPLTITGTADGLTRSTNVTLTVRDGQAPTVAAPRPWLYGPAMVGASTPVRLTWPAATDASGVASLALNRQVDGGAWSPVTVGAGATTWIESMPFGGAVADRLAATDTVGNTSPWAYGPTVAPVLTEQNSPKVQYGGTWNTLSASYLSGGSMKYARAQGAWASYTFTGAAISWIAYFGPYRGRASVYVDGTYRGTVNLYSNTYQGRRVAFALNWTANGTHTIKVVSQATTGHPEIDVDAFVTLALS